MAEALLLALGGLAAAALAGRLALAAARTVSDAQRRVVRAQHVLREQQRVQASLQALADVQAVAEEGVALGTGTVQAVHQGIAAIPFGILEAIPATRDTTKVVRAVHDTIAGTIYAAIKALNRRIGQGARQGLAPGGDDARGKEDEEQQAD